MRSGFAGIDLAIAKRKHLPVVLCTWQGERLVPESLRTLPCEPPRGFGNARTLDNDLVSKFAERTACYLDRICAQMNIQLERIAIDAPSAPRAADIPRRAAEAALDAARISCFTTPSEAEFEEIRCKVRRHLEGGGAENRIPHANQLWMIAGFSLFNRLSNLAQCIEVFPQATARVLGSGDIHKFKAGGVEAQLFETAMHTGWPDASFSGPEFESIAFGPAHDRLDAYLSAWVGALPEGDRIAFGNPPDDVIWAPRLAPGKFDRPLYLQREERRERKPARNKSSEFRRLCPACGEHEFQRWPYGWDSHAAHRCTGLKESSPETRKSEFKRRFASAFQ